MNGFLIFIYKQIRQEGNKNLNWFVLILSILYMINVLYDFFILKTTNKESTSNSNDSNNNIMDLFDILVLVVVTIISICLIVQIYFSSSFPLFVRIIFFSIPVLFYNLTETIKSSKSLVPLVLGNEIRNITIKDKFLCDSILGYILAFYNFIPIQKVISRISSLPLSNGISSILLSILILVFVFFMSFLLIVELIVPLFFVRLASEFVAKTVKHIKEKILFIVSKFLNYFPSARLTRRAYNSLKYLKDIINPFYIFLCFSL